MIYPIGYNICMSFVRQLRRRAGVTQQELARRAGTSQSAIAAYESGSKSPTLRTLERLASALDLEVDLELNRALTREERRSLAFHEAIAEKLMCDPQGIMEQAGSNLEMLQRLHPHARKLLRRWASWLKLPPADLAGLIVARNEVACDMRQVSPFSGVLSPAERSKVLRRFREGLAT